MQAGTTMGVAKTTGGGELPSPRHKRGWMDHEQKDELQPAEQKAKQNNRPTQPSFHSSETPRTLTKQVARRYSIMSPTT